MFVEALPLWDQTASAFMPRVMLMGGARVQYLGHDRFFLISQRPVDRWMLYLRHGSVWNKHWPETMYVGQRIRRISNVIFIDNIWEEVEIKRKITRMCTKKNLKSMMSKKAKVLIIAPRLVLFSTFSVIVRDRPFDFLRVGSGICPRAELFYLFAKRKQGYFSQCENQDIFCEKTKASFFSSIF